MDKPVVRGPVDGNAYAVMGAVTKALKRAGQSDKVPEAIKRMTSGDYDNLLGVAQEYVDFDLGDSPNEEDFSEADEDE